MDIADRVFITNHDWDPQYLREVLTEDFYEFADHWQNNILDMDLIEAERSGGAKYSPVVEDISLDDATLYEAVEQIEQE